MVVLGKYVEFYCGENNRELKKIVEPVLRNRFPWLAQKDYDDFYSIAAEVVWNCERRFDERRIGNREFKSYVSACIRKRIKARLTYMHRQKRILKDGQGNPVYEISMDAPIGGKEERCIAELLPSGLDLDDVVLRRMGFYEERVNRYLAALTKTQREIVKMKMEGISPCDIRRRLGISDKKYEQQCRELKSFANIRILFSAEEYRGFKGDERDMKLVETAENVRSDTISIASVIKGIDSHTLRFDHPFQRESGQWTPAMKGNLISDILQGNRLYPLVFAEQIVDGRAVIWDLDGKQRCANVYTFCKDGYRVAKNIRRWIISYQTTEKDEKGVEILDENGLPRKTKREFDIRGRRFSDLPRELKERFLRYCFSYDQYLNCSEADISYHMERYNDRKPMTASQRGIALLGAEYARRVKAIANMAFFKDMGNYKISEFKNGVIQRVVVEGVTAACFKETWEKDFNQMCSYLGAHGTGADFDRFESLVKRLEGALPEKTARLFNSGSSFLLFGLFARFAETDGRDERFAPILEEIYRDPQKPGGRTAKPGAERGKCAATAEMKMLERRLKEYCRG